MATTEETADTDANTHSNNSTDTTHNNSNNSSSGEDPPAMSGGGSEEALASGAESLGVLPYAWNDPEMVPTETRQLWVEVGHGIDKSQTGAFFVFVCMLVCMYSTVFRVGLWVMFAHQ